MEEANITNQECIELKNIKYKTMLINGVKIEDNKSSNDLLNLEKFLENEKNNNKNEPWCKLNKTIKIKKLIEYADIYKKTQNLNEEEYDLLILFFKDSLDRNKLQKVKDVIYDKITGEIREVPALHFVKSTKHFTLKNIEKRISTLKSLPPKKTNGTIKKKDNFYNKNVDNDSSSENEN
jgi:hypothetical protein